MPISAISANSSTYQSGGSNPMAQQKQNLNDLVGALKSGNLDDAKKAFNQLQKNAPPQGAADSKNPMSAEIQNLQKALDTGDLKGAQAAVSQMQAKMPQGPPPGGPGGGAPPKGPPPGGGRPPQGAKTDTVQLDSTKSGSTSSTSSSSTVYDKMDSNKDGTVSAMEALFYELKNTNNAASISVLTIKQTQAKSSIQTYA
jgi:hypothetical protein